VSSAFAITGSNETGTRRRALFERVHRLLRDAEPFGEFDLGEVLRFALGGDARSEGDEEGAVVVGDGHAGLE
jgi:hypothetical protein